jgi:DNA polymerase III subunit delta'
MPLAPLFGHLDARRRLAHAIAAQRLPQVLLLTGPAGVGKQRLALWLAQLLLCRDPSNGEPCGTCGPCRRVLDLAHPDVHWFVPVPRPRAGDPEKQADDVAAALADIMAARRGNPIWTAPEGTAGHGVASARLVQREASLTAVESRWRIFIIGHAERLVMQESSPDAANALLKLLEEPPPGAVFVLTAVEPGLLLPTMRSRAVPIRLTRLRDAEVRGFLAEVPGALATDDVIADSHGSIGAVLSAGTSGRAASRRAARELIAAAASGPAAAWERALQQPPWQARGDFTALLDALAETLAADTRRAVGLAGHVSTGNRATAILRPLAGGDVVTRVLEARERAQGNVNPQLLLAVLATELAGTEAA